VWSAFRESSFGHGLMDFLNDTTAVWNWQRNQDLAASKTSDTVRAPALCPFCRRPPACSRTWSQLCERCAHNRCCYASAPCLHTTLAIDALQDTSFKAGT